MPKLHQMASLCCVGIYSSDISDRTLLEEIGMMIKQKPQKNRVYIECSDSDRRVKGVIIRKELAELEVEMPTGFVMKMKRKNRRSPFIMRLGLLEFYSDGKEVS